MAYKEYFDTRVDFTQPTQLNQINQPMVHQEVNASPIDHQEYEMFKKFHEFQKEKEILMKYEREGLITIRRQTPEPVVVEEEKSEVSDVAMATMVLGGFIVIIRIAAWLLV